MGLYPPPPDAPADVPGLEYAGVVEAAGPRVRDVAIGDRVFGLVPGGAHAERIVTHAREVARLPDEIDFVSAAAIPEAYVTAYDALVTRGRLVPGERVLVHAVGSGVGTAALQILKALGCSVTGTSRTSDKLERAKTFGLDHGVLADGSPDALVDALQGVAPAGFDVVLDLVGGPYVEVSSRVAALRGRIVLVGLTGGAMCEVNLALLLKKRLELIGTVLRSRPLEERIQSAEILRKTVTPWLLSQRVLPVVDAIFPLDQIREAHARVASNATFGKVILELGSPEFE